MNRRDASSIWIAIAVVACVLAVIASPVVAQQQTASGSVDGPAAADHADPDPAFAVELQQDGTGQVHVTYAFDLADEDRKAAFEELRDNETSMAAFESRFQERIGAVADDAADATGREMAVDGVDLQFRTAENTGVVELSFTWQGMAAVDGDQLTVTEPFASGFEPDRPVHLRTPDGYEVASASPSPSSQDGDWHTWEAGTDLSGFEVVLESTDGESDGSADADGGIGPGFGVVAAVLGLLAALAILGRRRS